MNIILAHNSTKLSARILATKLGLTFTCDYRNLTSPPIIRYGNSYNSFGENDTKFNHPSVIKLCSHSLKFSKWAKENNIFSPQYRTITLDEEHEYPFLLRKIWHRGGKDIIKVKSKEQLDGINNLNSYYKVPYIITDYEIGVHVVLGKVVKLFKKIKREEEGSDFIRSSLFGWGYYLVSNLDDNFNKAQSIAQTIANRLELNFGRIDMGYNAEKKEYVVFEVNTGPGLNSKSAELYATLLRGTLKLE